MFEWDNDGMLFADLILGPAVMIERVWVKKAISKMTRDKAAVPSGIVVEIFKVFSETGIDLVTELHCK